MSWSNTNKQTPKLPIRRRIQSPRSTRLYQKNPSTNHQNQPKNPGIYQIIQHLPEVYRLLLHPNIFPIYHHFCWLKHVKSPKLWRNHVNSMVKNHVVLYPYYTNCIPNTPPILTKPLHPLPLPRLRPGLATSPLFPARRESAALGATTAP